MSGRFGCVGLILAFFLVCLIEWKNGAHAALRRDGENARAKALPLRHRLRIIKRAAPDVSKYLPLKFDRELDNPCFHNGSSLLCLPAFFVAGGMQCGGSDLWRRLRAHEHISDHHDAAPHRWTNHPRSTAGSFDRYLSLFSDRRTLAQVRAQPHTLLGDVSPASFGFIMAEQLRIHYQYLDAFDACSRTCRGKAPPAAVSSQRNAPPTQPARSLTLAATRCNALPLHCNLQGATRCHYTATTCT